MDLMKLGDIMTPYEPQPIPVIDNLPLDDYISKEKVIEKLSKENEDLKDLHNRYWGFFRDIFGGYLSIEDVDMSKVKILKSEADPLLSNNCHVTLSFPSDLIESR